MSAAFGRSPLAADAVSVTVVASASSVTFVVTVLVVVSDSKLPPLVPRDRLRDHVRCPGCTRRPRASTPARSRRCSNPGIVIVVPPVSVITSGLPVTGLFTARRASCAAAFGHVRRRRRQRHRRRVRVVRHVRRHRARRRRRFKVAATRARDRLRDHVRALDVRVVRAQNRRARGCLVEPTGIVIVVPPVSVITSGLPVTRVVHRSPLLMPPPSVTVRRRRRQRHRRRVRVVRHVRRHRARVVGDSARHSCP